MYLLSDKISKRKKIALTEAFLTFTAQSFSLESYLENLKAAIFHRSSIDSNHGTQHERIQAAILVPVAIVFDKTKTCTPSAENIHCQVSVLLQVTESSSN